MMTACDQGFEGEDALEEAAALEASDDEALLEEIAANEQQEDVDARDAWDGLTPEDILALELEFETGEDAEPEPFAGAPSDDFTAAPEAFDAPGCVGLSQWKSGIWSYARVRNNCSYPVRVRLIWQYAIDGTCKYLSPGYSFSEGRARQARVTEVRSC